MKPIIKINYTVKDGQLYTPTGDHVLPDQAGIVSIVIDGVTRRFILTKLIDKINSGTEIKLNTVSPRVKSERSKATKATVVEKPKTPKKVKPEKIKKASWEHLKKPIIAIDRNNVEHPFPSAAAASKALKVSSSGIVLVMSGKYQQMNGYTFRRPGDPKKTFPIKQCPNKHKCRPVLAISPQGLAVPYESAQAAHKALGMTRQSICLVLKGKRKAAKGYQFKYKTA